MTGPEHYREAERLEGAACVPGLEHQWVMARLARAQVHATLALTAATVEAADQQIDTNYKRQLVLRPTNADDVDPAFPGTPWGRALYGEVTQ